MTIFINHQQLSEYIYSLLASQAQKLTKFKRLFLSHSIGRGCL